MSVPSNLCRLHYPITTAEAQKFWASRHKCNRMKSIIAFSTDLSDANMNLRNAGYKYFWRTRALNAFGAFTNQPNMINIPFTPMSVPWWECMGEVSPAPPTDALWLDEKVWVDINKWGEQMYG